MADNICAYSSHGGKRDNLLTNPETRVLSDRSGALPLDQRETNIDGALADRFPCQALQQQFARQHTHQLAFPPARCSTPVPTVKLASNTAMYTRMEGDMDINCGVVIDGEKPVQEMG